MNEVLCIVQMFFQANNTWQFVREICSRESQEVWPGDVQGPEAAQIN